MNKNNYMYMYIPQSNKRLPFRLYDNDGGFVGIEFSANEHIIGLMTEMKDILSAVGLTIVGERNLITSKNNYIALTSNVPDTWEKHRALKFFNITKHAPYFNYMKAGIFDFQSYINEIYDCEILSVYVHHDTTNFFNFKIHIPTEKELKFYGEQPEPYIFIHETMFLRNIILSSLSNYFSITLDMYNGVGRVVSGEVSYSALFDNYIHLEKNFGLLIFEDFYGKIKRYYKDSGLEGLVLQCERIMNDAKEALTMDEE